MEEKFDQDLTVPSVVYNEDCVEGMKRFSDNYFDLAIVDPPYGIGVSKSKEIGYKGFNKFTPKDWDNETPKTEYWEQLFRVSKNQIVFGGNYFALPPTRCFLIWDKGEGFYNRTYAECEMAWTSFDANAKIYKRDPLAKRDYKGKIHPTQKPVSLYDWILMNFAKDGYKILDTMVGSGSSRIACNKAGLEYTGFEIDTEYYEKQEKRFIDFVSQTRLFLESIRENSIEQIRVVCSIESSSIQIIWTNLIMYIHITRYRR